MKAFSALFGRWMGLDGQTSVSDARVAFSSSWAQLSPWLVVAFCTAALIGSWWFYNRTQHTASRSATALLAIMRGMLFVVLIVILAAPAVVVEVLRKPKPTVCLLFDASQSMALEDELTTDARSTGLSRASRVAQLRALLDDPRVRLIDRLRERFELRSMRFDGPDSLRSVTGRANNERQDGAVRVGESYVADGSSTSIGSALEDLAQNRSSNVDAAVVVFSDFDQNAGPDAIATAQRLGIPVYTVGLGPVSATDLTVDISAPSMVRKGQRATVSVVLKQQALDGQATTVTVRASRRDSIRADTSLVIGERQVKLDLPSQSIDVAFAPPETGRWLLTAEATVLPTEALGDNNTAESDVTVIDEAVRVTYVDYEPNWEWRHLKELFERDSLVGPQGFRTYLRSSDPKVRQGSELFLSTITPPRREFFASDVVIVGDVPAAMLSKRFCDRTRELVGAFGGVLIVLAGPRYGLSELFDSGLADMLPVVVDPDTEVRDDHPFSPRLTSSGARFEFMRLSDNPAENRKLWQTDLRLPWYQPVLRVRDGASVLLAHPTDRCTDGETPQPIVAIRPYGRGQVLYLASNETWRLRRKHGERLYRRFWGEMLFQLAAVGRVGGQKRFVIQTDRSRYQVTDEVLVSADVYDENFEALSAEAIEERTIVGQLQRFDAARTDADALPEEARPLSLLQVRSGRFEARLQSLLPGAYKVRLLDPITDDTSELDFRVTDRSVERHSVVRNVALAEQLAATTGGRSYDLQTVTRLPDDIQAHSRPELSIERVPLTSSWACFALVVGLMLGEWLVRRLVNLP
jgi:hypothetical protein